jgi:hypothetical protein
MDIRLFGVLAMSWLVGIHDVYVCSDLKGLIFALKIVSLFAWILKLQVATFPIIWM